MSTIEYVAVVLLVSIVLAVGGAQIAGVDIAEAVGRKIKVALCVVANEDCDENGEEEACVVSSESEASDSSLSITVIRAKDGRTVLVERLSNGKYRVSVTQTTGVGAGTGLSAGVKLWKWKLDAGVDAAAYATAGYERVFEVDGKAAAERLVDKLDDDDWKLAGAAKGAVEMIKGDHAGAQEQSFEVGAESEAEAALQALDFEPGMASIAGGWTAGIRLNHATGERSLTLGHDISVSADVNLQMASMGVGASAPRSFELKFDRHNRPKALVLRAGIEGSGSAKVELGRAGTSGSLVGNLSLAGGARGEVEAELALDSPELAPYVQRVLKGDMSAIAPLVATMPSAARIKAQAYQTTEDSDGWAVGAKLPLVGEVGVGNERIERTTKLLGAIEHKPGTPITAWEQDCVARV